MKKILSIVLAAVLMACPVLAQQPSSAVGHSHTSAATITISAPANALHFIYITGIDISNCANGTAVTAAAPTYITTTNLTGAPQYQLGSGVTAGLCQPTITAPNLTTPLRATTAGAAVTFVLPTFAANQIVSVNVYYYVGPAF